MSATKTAASSDTSSGSRHRSRSALGMRTLLGLSAVESRIRSREAEECSVLALGLGLPTAVPARAARGHRRTHDAIPDLDLSDRGPDLAHDADELVSHGRAPLEAGHVPPVGQQVSTADRGRRDIDDGVVGVDDRRGRRCRRQRVASLLPDGLRASHAPLSEIGCRALREALGSARRRDPSRVPRSTRP